MKVIIVFYSMYGHIYRMAEAVADGVKEVKDATVEMFRVPETLTDDVLKKMGAFEIQKN
jgi:NAD(P)H dehydrogenase (quinone)